MNAQPISLQFETVDYPGEHGAIYTAEHAGFTVNIKRDACPSNPFEEWDCEPALVVASYGYGGRSDISTYGDSDALNPLAFISDGMLQRRQRDICKALDVDHADIHSEALALQRDYAGRLVDHKRDLLDDRLSDASHGNAGDYLEAVAALFSIAGIEALSSCSSGYSQGDYVDVLAVALPAWAEKTGAPRASHAAQLAYAVKLYGFWAWGDVYGYEIEDAQGEHVDSCWGFYSDDIDGRGFTESGMADHALPALAYAIAERDKAAAEEMESARPDMYATA